MQLFKCVIWSFARLWRLKLALDLPRRISEAIEHSNWLHHRDELFMRNYFAMKSQTIPARFAIAMRLQKDFMTNLLQKYKLRSK